MSIDYIILYVSIVVWIVVAFRQKRSRFFLFFLLLALEDPVALVFTDVFGYTSIDSYIYFDLARFLSLFSKDEIIKNRFIFGIAFGFVLMLHFMGARTLYDVLLNSVIHFAIFLKLLHLTIQEVSFSRVINIFLLVLLFYQLNTVTKIVNTLTMFSDSIYYFLMSSALQILLGIFFCIYTENNRRLFLSLK